MIPESQIERLGCAVFCYPNYPMEVVGDLHQHFDVDNLYDTISICAAHAQSRRLKTFGLTYTTWCFVGEESVKDNYQTCGASVDCAHNTYGTDDSIFVFALK